MTGKLTTISREVESPTVDFAVSHFGRVSGKLTAYRDKQGGGLEEIKLSFPDLTIWELQCIARSSIKALREVRKNQDDRVREAIQSATGWTEGDGPDV